MIAVRPNTASYGRVLWLAVALALITAFSYLLMAWDVLGIGDLRPEEEGGAIVFVAAVSYLIGGLLILARRRWLWIVGAVVNALVMIFFFMMYQDRPAVLFSPGGLASKAVQLLLEATLIYLIVTDWWRARRQSGG
ncbi:MAG: hypothetical protein DCC55_24420 [Chloroflexi bacterium]|nr:MAG: hypothetical protein DCC55_24420 [Chloroflexota bacterium]